MLLLSIFNYMPLWASWFSGITFYCFLVTEVAGYCWYLVGQFTWVKLDFLEAWLRPVEQFDKRPPCKVEERIMQEKQAGAPLVNKSKSRKFEKSKLLRGNRMPIIMDVWLTNSKYLNLAG